jgi:hypothetical protein
MHASEHETARASAVSQASIETAESTSGFMAHETDGNLKASLNSRVISTERFAPAQTTFRRLTYPLLWLPYKASDCTQKQLAYIDHSKELS